MPRKSSILKREYELEKREYYLEYFVALLALIVGSKEIGIFCQEICLLFSGLVSAAACTTFPFGFVLSILFVGILIVASIRLLTKWRSVEKYGYYIMFILWLIWIIVNYANGRFAGIT